MDNKRGSSPSGRRWNCRLRVGCEMVGPGSERNLGLWEGSSAIWSVSQHVRDMHGRRRSSIMLRECKGGCQSMSGGRTRYRSKGGGGGSMSHDGSQGLGGCPKDMLSEITPGVFLWVIGWVRVDRSR